MVATSQAVVITQWNFNSNPADGNTGTGSLDASTGFGTASTVGGTSSAFASGTSNGGSTDPAATDNSGWQTSAYAAQGTGNKTAGVQLLTSTSGYEDITVSFDVRKSNTSSRFLQFQYTTDGTTWVDFGDLLDGNAGDTWFNNNSFDLSSVSAVENNANFGLRVVAAFDPAGSGYLSSNSASAYATSGTVRYDMFTVSGTQVVPEPATLAALGLGAMALIRRKRNK